VGHSSGPNATISAGVLRGKQLTMTGFAGLHTAMREKVAALTWLWDSLGSGQLHVPVNTISIEELPVAWREQAASPHAKYVVLHAHP
jgi:NADPH2:quinone reductase